ncbi:PHD finger protein 7-like [Excalfactoria chinensis]|uniref:PHD finger protein 7-like n=1 Tax=Excalfactoria chinensis TaxID=46218 RepID=UPI003B39FBD9
MGQTLCSWFRSIQEAARLEEPACVLCGLEDEDSAILGNKQSFRRFSYHEFCARFASGLCANVQDNNEARFRFEDLTRTVREAEQKLCFVCGSSGATITCADPDCERSFHLPCAYEGQCVTKYFGEFRAFCWEHRPQQAVQAAPEPDTTCIICIEPVDESRSYGTMVCPACQHAWLHRACVQRMALSSGIRLFHCPNCRDTDTFLQEMLTLGIRIPDRMQIRWENTAYSGLAVWHRRCMASECLYSQGRLRSGEGPWELLLCSSCAARGTHRLCSHLSDSTTSWECNACAGEGTASSTSSGLAGLSTTSQQGLQPSQSSVSPESSSSSIQAPSGPDHGSCVPESSIQSSTSIQSRTDRRRIPARPCRDENILNESRGRRGRTHSAALMAESSTDSMSQGTSRSSRRCPALVYNLRCRQGQRARTRSRSPLRRRAPASPSRPQRHRGSRPTATPGAQSCTRSSRTPAAPGSSRASPTAHRSPFRHPGRARTRSRSPLHRRAADTDSQPRRRRTSRSRRRGPAQGRSYSRVPRRAQHITGRPC